MAFDACMMRAVLSEFAREFPEAKIEKGAKAEFMIADLNREWTVEPEKFASKSRNSVFKGEKLTGKVLLIRRFAVGQFVNHGNEDTVDHKAAGCFGEQFDLIRNKERDLDTCKAGVAQHLADDGHGKQCQCKTNSHPHTVQCRFTHGIFTCEHFGTA